MIPAGIVLTGGTSKMEGAVELAEEIFHMSVRLGTPQELKGLADVVRDPIYATSVGLLHYGKRHHAAASNSETSRESPLIRIKRWFKGNF
jgi:cell division protein FtsA